MEQNQNDNTSNVAMGSTFRCHIHSCYHCFKVQDGVRDDCQMSVSNLEDTFIIMQGSKNGIFPINLGANCIMSITLCLS